LSFPIPENETRRLAAVRELDILETAPDIAYDEIGELAAQICHCPVAYISFMEDDRLWLKAKYGAAVQVQKIWFVVGHQSTRSRSDLLATPDL
jgi:hypothetical protein